MPLQVLTSFICYGATQGTWETVPNSLIIILISYQPVVQLSYQPGKQAFKSFEYLFLLLFICCTEESEWKSNPYCALTFKVVNQNKKSMGCLCLLRMQYQKLPGTKNRKNWFVDSKLEKLVNKKTFKFVLLLSTFAKEKWKRNLYAIFMAKIWFFRNLYRW